MRCLGSDLLSPARAETNRVRVFHLRLTPLSACGLPARDTTRGLARRSCRAFSTDADALTCGQHSYGTP